MGLIATKEIYFEAVKELYPEGSFFKEQFENKDSDFYKLAKAQAQSIYNFKKELNKLWLEARLETCTEETIEHYEKLLTGIIRNDLNLEERKSILLIQSKNSIDIDTLNLIANRYYTADILSIKEKFDVSTFGFSRFGKTRIFNYRAFCLVMISLTIEDASKKEEFESFLETIFMANKVIIYNYILPNIEDITVDYINKIIKYYVSGCTSQRIEKDFKESLFAHSQFGRTRIFNYKASNAIIIYAALAGRRKRALFENIFSTVFIIDKNKTVFFEYVSPEEIDLESLNNLIQKYDANIIKAKNYFDESTFGEAKLGQTRIFNYINDKAIIMQVRLNNNSLKTNFESYVRAIYPKNILFFEYI